MKKFLLSLALLGLLLCFANCGKANTLTVYVVDTEPLYVRAVDRFASDNPDINLEIEKFSNYEEMNDRLNTELMSGKGPDVLLMHSNKSSTDAAKLVESGAFLPLDEYVASLEDDSYYPAIMDAGKVDNTQYLLPLSWNVMQVYYTENLAVEQELDLSLLYDTIRLEAESLMNQDDKALAALGIKRKDMTNYYLELSGVSLSAEELIAADKSQVSEVASFTKLFYDEELKRKEICTKYTDYPGLVARIPFFIEDFSFGHTLRIYQTIIPLRTGETFVPDYFQQLDGGMTAHVMHFGGISANTDMKEEAWLLLKHVMEEKVDFSFGKYDEGVYYMPVTISGYETAVSKLSVEAVPGTKVIGLDNENTAILEDLPEKITDAVIPNQILGSIVEESMMPYYQGSADFDSCYENMVQKVNLYLSE